MKRILFVSDTYNGYGAEKILQWIGLSLSQKGYDVIFCEMFRNDNPMSCPSNVIYCNLGLERGCSNGTYLRVVNKALISILKRHQCEYAVSFLKNSFYNLLFLRPFFHYKLIISERNDPYSLNSRFEKIKKFFVRYGDIVVFQTEGARSFYTSIPLSKSVIIPNPINIPPKQWSRVNAERLIINVGRLHISKRQDILIKAFKSISLVYPEYKLVLLGDGPDSEKLKTLTKNLGLLDSVVFAGKVNDVDDWMLRGSLFVLSSVSEGIPNALMEAMAIGMPVISTDCSPGGAKMLINDGVNGLLVENENQKELEDEILYMLENPEIADSMAAQARNDMRIYDPEFIIDKWIELFK